MTYLLIYLFIGLVNGLILTLGNAAIQKRLTLADVFFGLLSVILWPPILLITLLTIDYNAVVLWRKKP